MGKSRRISRGSRGRLATPSSPRDKSGRNSNDSTPAGRVVVPALVSGAALSALGREPDAPGIVEGGTAARKSASVVGTGGGDEGNAGKPGADCAPGTPGNENKALIEGNEATAPG